VENPGDLRKNFSYFRDLRLQKGTLYIPFCKLTMQIFSGLFSVAIAGLVLISEDYARFEGK